MAHGASRLTVALVVAGVALVVAACGGTATSSTGTGSTASPRAATDAATPGGVTSTPRATSSPGDHPSPGRTADADTIAATDALSKFSLLTQEESLSFSLQQTGSFTAAAGSSDYEYEIDVAGSDFDAAITLGGDRTLLRGVDGRVWASEDGNEWAETPVDPSDITDITTPWQYLGDLDALTFISRAPQQMEAFQFGNSGPVPYQTSSMRAAGITGEITTLSFVVLPDGTPVEFTFAAESPDGVGGTVETTSIVRFSNVGEPMAIEAPA